MFCPKCGKSDQTVNTYCRNCGSFLPDFDNLKKKETTPEAHLQANSILNLMTAIVSLTFAILLYAIFLGKSDTPPIIYATAGFLVAMTAWQIQTFWRTLLLKKHFNRNKQLREQTDLFEDKQISDTKITDKMLNKPDLSDFVPASVAEQTTKNLTKQPRR
jgi:hypothetical protein